jgi:hypothetical protein
MAHPPLPLSPGQNSLFFPGLAQVLPFWQKSLNKLLDLLSLIYSSVKWALWDLPYWTLGEEQIH